VAVQVVPQAVFVAQVYPLQLPATGLDWAQLPWPSHEPVVVEVVPLFPEQAKVPAQPVPFAVYAQAPPPLPPL
jgi:hypothetical protein